VPHSGIVAHLQATVIYFIKYKRRSYMALPLQSPGLKQADTVAHAIVRALARHGIDTLFGQSLPSMLHLAAEEAGFRQIAYRTENAGGYMADAHARVSGKPAVV